MPSNSGDSVVPKSDKDSLAHLSTPEPSLGLGTALTAEALYLQRGTELNG